MQSCARLGDQAFIRVKDEDPVAARRGSCCVSGGAKVVTPVEVVDLRAK
jgi:hypothetical protein